MENKLSAEEIAIIEKAEKAKKTLSKLGLDEESKKEDNSSNNENNIHDTFLEIQGLPSKNYFYENTLKGQPLITSDMLLIQTINDYNIDDRFAEIFKRRIRGVRPDEILYAEEIYIAFWLREASLRNEPWPHDAWQCQKCDLKIPSDQAFFNYKSIKFNSNIDKIHKYYADKGYVEFTLPDSKKTCKMYLKRRGHVKQAKNAINDNFYKHELIPETYEEEAMELLSNIDMGYDSLIETYYEFQELSAVDFNEFIKNVNNYSFNVDTKIQLTCPSCQEVTPMMEYPFRVEIYFPSYTG